LRLLVVVLIYIVSEREKKKACAEWDAFAERCSVKPVEVKPKSKGKKSNGGKS
jgi:hypothetical protein